MPVRVVIHREVAPRRTRQYVAGDADREAPPWRADRSPQQGDGEISGLGDGPLAFNPRRCGTYVSDDRPGHMGPGWWHYLRSAQVPTGAVVLPLQASEDRMDWHTVCVRESGRRIREAMVVRAASVRSLSGEPTVRRGFEVPDATLDAASGGGFRV